MLAKCVKCGQVRNLTKGLCYTCYHRENYKKRASIKHNKALKCAKCGTLLRNKSVKLCTYCRTKRENYEKRIQGILKKIEVAENFIEICKEYENNSITFKEIADKKGVSKQYIAEIVSKGEDFYVNKIKNLKKQFAEIAIKIKEFDKEIDD